MARAVVLAWCGLLAISVMFLASTAGPSLALQATPEATQPVTVSSEVLGGATPVDVEDPELALGRVTVMSGAVLPVHYHPGTQIAVIAQGTLRYTAYTGTVDWFRAGDANGPPRQIAAGETVEVPAGDTLIETPASIHQGRNKGDTPVIIYLSTLFPRGAPRAIVVEASPAP
jgi:quercetin dioxygenase-like cupin family protein